MNKEKDFFKTCFDTVAGLEVKNKSQAIAKEVVLSEIENLQQENKQLKEVIEEVREYIEKTPIGSILEVHCGYEEEYTKPLLQILDKAKERINNIVRKD